jgi:DNA polymerase iota
MSQVLKELRILATSLMKRMHVDLLEDDEDGDPRWIAHPKTLRLATRPRPPLNSDGTRSRTFNRISRSGPLPSFIFNLKDGIDAIVEKLVQDALIPMFRKLHPYPTGWNLSLVNIGVTNMVETASEDGSGGGRDIGRMFKRQEEVLKEWKIEDKDVPPDPIPECETCDAEQTDPTKEISDSIMAGSEDVIYPTQIEVDENEMWEENEDEDESREKCSECGAVMPAFAMAAHERFHTLEE